MRNIVDILLFYPSLMSVFIDCSFSPGDVAMIQPENMTSFVEKFLGLLNLDPTTELRVTGNDPGL